jgi:putative spermidine/putrescine transport system substrate-binding protein
MLLNGLLRFPALAAAAAMLAGPGLAADITVVGWGGTWDQAYKEGVWDVYTAETGNNIVMEEWAGELAKVRAQVQSGNVTYDLVAAEAPSVEIGCAEGLFVPLGEDVTGPADSYLPGTLHECGVASDTWATILAYDKGAFPDGGPTSWADYFDTGRFPGKRGMLGQAQYTLENALMGDGVPAAEVYDVLRTPEGIERAFAMLDAIRDDVVWWSTTTQAIQNLSSGEVVMTDQYNARITNEILTEGKDWDIVWEAGFFYGTDMWAVVAGAPNEAEAVELVRWFSEPEHQAGFSRLYAYGTGRREAANFIPPEQLEHLPSAPQHADFGAEYDTEFWVENKESLEARFKAWLEQ